MKNGRNLKSWLATAILLLAGNLWTLGAGAAEVLDVPSRDDNASVIAPELYCVIDLSEGSNATNYPVSYFNGEPEGGFNTDEYKTTKLVLRRIAPGTFVMAGSCTVTLTKPFYIGLFEFTQKQYTLVMGSNPSAHGGDKRPVERVSWNDVRGNASTYNWPEVKNIDPNSLAGRLRTRTGLNFDLPTEAQWEYACRAGTTGDYNNGGDLGVLGRYSANRGDGKGGYSEHTTVGSYLSNGWGLYDMHGNIWEWCLDRWKSPLSDTSAIDPDGPGSPTSGQLRVMRGGSWTHSADKATSSWRGSPNTPTGSQDYNGFRIACPSGEKYEQSIDFSPIGPQLATNQVVLLASATSGNEVTFSVVSGGGVVAGNILTFTEPGSVIVAAHQDGDEIWDAAEIVTQEVVVQAVPTRLAIEGLSQTYDGVAKEVTVTTEPEGIAVRVTYDGAEEAPVHAGDYAVVAETVDVRFAGRAEGTLKVVKAAQAIEFPAVGWQEWTNEVVLGAVAESGLVVEYAVVSGPGRVNGNSLTFTGPGSVVVRASQSGNQDWNPAEDVFLEVVAGKATAQVILGDLVQVYDGDAKAVTVMTAPTGLEVRIAYDGVVAAPQAAGRYDVTATVEDEKWVGSATGTLVVSKGSQSIEFGEIGAQAATNVVELSAVASTGMEVKFAVLSGPGTVAGNVLSFTGAGTVTVMALQEGDANWAQATVLRSVSVSAVPVEVVLSGLERVYDGEGKAVGVATVPEGVAVRVTYDGSEGAPVGAGEYAVVAESADGRYAGRAEGVLVIAKGAQSIEFAEIGEQVATNVVEMGATASSGLAVSYAVEGPVVLEGGVLRFTGAGTVTVTASQAGDGNWEAAEDVARSFEVVKAAATVALGSLEQVFDNGTHGVTVETVPEGLSVVVTYDGEDALPVGAGSYGIVATVVDDVWEGSAEGTLVVAKGAQSIEFVEIGGQVATNVVELEATASSGLAVSYTVEGPAVLEGGVLRFTGAGAVTVTASQAGDGNWEAAEDVVRSFEVVKALATVTLGNLEQVFDNGTHAVTVETVPEGLSVVVTYDGVEGLPVGAGSYGIVATVVDDVWEGSAEGTLVVAKGAQGIEFAEIGAQVATNVVELGATASSGLAVEYAVDGPAVLEGGVLSFTGAGVVTVTASQAGDGNWEAAEDVVRSFEVVKASATVTLGSLEQVFDKGPHAVTVETVPEGLSVVVTYEGSGEAPTEAGSYGVLAVVDDAIWEGSAEGTLLIAKGLQSIEFAGIDGQVATNTVGLEATASSGLAVSYAVEGPAVLEGSVLSFMGSGTVTVTASQAGDGNWEAAEAVSVSFEVRKAVAEVSLEGGEQVFDGKTHRVEVATVPEGLTVAVTYDGSGEEPVDAGSYAVVATVVDDRWEGSASGTLVVAKGTQGIEFGEIGEQVATNVVVLGAVASSGLEVSYTVVGSAVVEGSVLSFTGSGTVTVTASQAGDGNWEAAEAVSVSFEVRKAVAEVSLEGVEQVFDGKTHRVEVVTVPEGLSVAVTYDGNGEEPVDAGAYDVVATVVDDRWEGSATGTLVVAKGSQSIAFGGIGDQVVTNVVELGAVASSGLAVGYSVEGPAVLEGSVLRFSGVGVVSVTASQAGDGNWEAAEAVSVSFEVRKAVAGVVLEGLEQVYDGKTHRVGVGTVPEGLSVAVTYDGEEAEPVGAGSYRVVAVVVDEVWEGSAEGVLSIAKGAQEIVFPEIGPCGVADRVELSAVAGSGLEVMFAVLSGPGYLEGAVLRFADTGSVAVVAMQGGDGNWEAAEPVRQVVEVGKSAAAVVLGGLEQVYDGNAHAVAVETVPAGLAVEVAYDGSANAPVDAGSYEVVATVVDAKWAGCATGVLHVAKGTQEITFPAIGPQVVTNRVVLGAVASSGLPVGYAVAAGPGWVEDGVLSFSGVGEVAVVASQYGNGNWEAAAEVTNVVEVSGLLSLSVVSAHGVVSPAAGTHEVMIGTAVEAVAEAEPVVLGEGWRAVCTGWRLEGNGPEAGTGTVAVFTLTNSATLTWLWETQALVRAEGLAHGTAEGSGWYALGAVAVLEAVPDEGHSFTGWEGDVPGWQMGSNPVELAVEGPEVVLATFFTTFCASVDGDDAADGLSWSTAKREIAAALALAAEGDSVVASDGAYGAVSVPDGVSVRSVGGADVTRIAGGDGVRCVVAGAGASVEGFTLVGASVEGDGGRALLAGDAVLRRCVLQGNRAGGCGGGASGGTLENCLVVGNGASAGGGGGACGAVLRHCTVVRNEGGGARDCRSVNCVFWENGGDDVAGGETSWSRCSPAAPGSGNIEDEPVFAGGGDWRLAYESPCIDAAAESGVRVDLDGAPRPQPRVYGGELKPDMGCREYVPKARFVWDQGRAVPPYESWGDAARDIQSALDVSGSGDRIVVEAGTYGPIAVSNAVIVMGYRGAGETVIDAQGAERAVFLGGGGTLEGFTVRGGVSEDCGGILADGGSTVRDVVVEGCRATGAEGVGGGVCLYGGSVAENVTARGNAAAYGAGVYATATSAVVRCEMDGNTASAWGGGAYLEADSRMEGSRLSSNSAVRGGGVYGADCEVAACGLDGNAASGAGGGAALLRATFRNNRVAGNRAASGGGVHAQGSDGHDCLVTGNEAPKGAGVWMEGDGQFWNFTVADNGGTGAGVALRGTSLFGNGIAWGNAGGNLDAAAGTEVRHTCAAPAPDGEGNFAADPSFVGDGDYHLRAGSPCVDAGEVQDWMPDACDFDGQRRVESGEAGDGRDIWVDIGTDEAALDAVEAPSAASPWWTWRVVLDAKLQLQRTGNLRDGAGWENLGAPFTATSQRWGLNEAFDEGPVRAYRLIWLKGE